MKTTELQALGLTQEQIDGVFKINGIDVENAKAGKDKTISDLTAERDDLKARLTTAENTLKSFEGIDPEKLQGEIQSYKKKAEEAEAHYQQQITQRDQRDWLNHKLDEYGVASPFARKQLITEATAEGSGLSWKDGAFFGFDDFMKFAKEKDVNLYQTAEEKAAAEKEAAQKKRAPIFTGRADDPAPASAKFTPPKIF